MPQERQCYNCKIDMSTEDLCRWRNTQMENTIKIKHACLRCREKAHEVLETTMSRQNEENWRSHMRTHYDCNRPRNEELIFKISSCPKQTRESCTVETIASYIQKTISDIDNDERIREDDKEHIQKLKEDLTMICDVALSRLQYEEDQMIKPTTKALLPLALDRVHGLYVASKARTCHQNNCQSFKLNDTIYTILCKDCRQETRIKQEEEYEEDEYEEDTDDTEESLHRQHRTHDYRTKERKRWSNVVDESDGEGLLEDPQPRG